MVPGEVASRTVLIFIVLLFRQGVNMVTNGGFSYEKGLIVCISLWVGLGFQYGDIFPAHLIETNGCGAARQAGFAFAGRGAQVAVRRRGARLWRTIVKAAGRRFLFRASRIGRHERASVVRH